MDTRLLDSVSTSKWPLTLQPIPFLAANPVTLLCLALSMAVVILVVRYYQGSRDTTRAPVTSQVKADESVNIEPVNDFDLNSAEPPVFRPFKPKYHLTMGTCYGSNAHFPDSN